MMYEPISKLEVRLWNYVKKYKLGKNAEKPPLSLNKWPKQEQLYQKVKEHYDKTHNKNQ